MEVCSTIANWSVGGVKGLIFMFSSLLDEEERFLNGEDTMERIAHYPEILDCEVDAMTVLDFELSPMGQEVSVYSIERRKRIDTWQPQDWTVKRSEGLPIAFSPIWGHTAMWSWVEPCG